MALKHLKQHFQPRKWPKKPRKFLSSAFSNLVIFFYSHDVNYHGRKKFLSTKKNGSTPLKKPKEVDFIEIK
jgi:hypothetical protein